MDIANLGQLGGGLGLDFDEPAPGEEKKKKSSKKKDDEVGGGKSDLIHIRVQQRNGRKCITTVQGLHQDLDLKKILKALKKQECCNGTVVEDEEMGAVLQLQGDQRDSVAKFLTEMGMLRTMSTQCWSAFLVGQLPAGAALFGLRSPLHGLMLLWCLFLAICRDRGGLQDQEARRWLKTASSNVRCRERATDWLLPNGSGAAAILPLEGGAHDRCVKSIGILI